jgi:hypothetical protein
MCTNVEIVLSMLCIFSVVCGQRVRVEHAKARSVNYRGGPSYGGYRGGE